ncbi:hypothetical protein HU200_050474 [Digitaria exilis]|uniref:Uncharacterized protein n=1 Tax=Digitaria exilis TaxID=1010633 RepID=A0A835B2M8_9POAL|nr:hypothetical protein HU200_050474 [Digitaria exilis]
MFNPAAYAVQHPGAMPPPPFHLAVPLVPQFGVPVRSVWGANFDAEMVALRGFAARASSVAFAVHYPGVVHGHGGGATTDHNTLTAEQRYAAVKANVDALKPLQVGLAVGTRDGLCLAWEFNLRGFDPATDPHAPGSIEYLASRGMDLDAHRARGVPMARLTYALHRCGLLRRPGLTWVTYAGAYHAAYLLKVIGGGLPLPGDVAGFLAAMQRFLGGDVYDVARMASDCPYMPVGLERVAATIGLASPQCSPGLAGAGAAIALHAFMSLMFNVFMGDVNRYRGLLHGIQAT